MVVLKERTFTGALGCCPAKNINVGCSLRSECSGRGFHPGCFWMNRKGKNNRIFSIFHKVFFLNRPKNL